MGIKRRGGGKHKTLFRTVTTPVNFSDDDSPEKRKRDIAAMNEIVRRGSLKAQLADYEKTAKHILKEYGLKNTWPDYLEYVGKYELPLPASYAADILFNIHGVRNFVKNDDAKNAAVEALRLGFKVAAMQAELAVRGKEVKRTGTATESRIKAVDIRQEKMKAIATETGWQPGQALSKTELQGVYTLLRNRHPEYKDKPKNQTLSADAKEIGLKG